MKAKNRGARPVDQKYREQGSLKDPTFGDLKEDFEFSLNERESSVFTRARINHETRYTIWPNKSEDGRKWFPKRGDMEVFPWMGASDASVNLVDLYIKKDVAFFMVLWQRMKTRVTGTEINDEAWANRMTSYLRWQKYSQMLGARAENELMANTLCERGSAIVGTFWDKRAQLGYEEIDLEGIATAAFQKAQDLAASGDSDQAQVWQDLPNMVLRPGSEEEAAALLAQLYPDVKEGRFVKVCEDLRQLGSAKFPRPQIVANRPKIVAYTPNEDVFLSPDAFGPEDGTVHCVEVMREAKLRGRGLDYGWDPEWVEKIIETQRGNVTYGGQLFNRRITREANYLLPTRGDMGTRKSFIVIYSYRRLTNEDGVPGIYHTVWHPHISDVVGKHELLNYEHGESPFTLITTEKRSRRPDDARGYGEVAKTWQDKLKTEWDSRSDRASIATLPPSHYPPGQQPDKWGPGVQVPTSNPDGYGFFNPPKWDPGSKEMEETVREFSDEYFGCSANPEKAVDMQNMRQLMADNWMDGQKRIDTQVLQLCQQFEDDEIFFRVVGSSKGKAIHTTRDEIQGKFDLTVGFDVQDMNPELMQGKLQLVQQLVQMDVNGIVDHNEALAVGFEVIDPNLGERLLKPAESASQQEVEDEQNAAVKLGMGIEVPVKPGQAYQLRLQTLTNLLQTNAQLQKQIEVNPQAQQAVQARLKALQFQLQQQQNAVIGRGGPNFKPKLAGKS